MNKMTIVTVLAAFALLTVAAPASAYYIPGPGDCEFGGSIDTNGGWSVTLGSNGLRLKEEIVGLWIYCK